MNVKVFLVEESIVPNTRYEKRPASRHTMKTLSMWETDVDENRLEEYADFAVHSRMKTKFAAFVVNGKIDILYVQKYGIPNRIL